MLNRCSFSRLFVSMSVVVAMALSWHASASVALSQDQQDRQASGSAQDQRQKNEADTSSGESPARAFEAKLQEWKEIIKQLRGVKIEFDRAAQEQVAELQTRWDNLVAQGEAMIPELRELGIKAYEAEPNEDLGLVRFLLKILEDDTERDDYDSAAQLAGVLIEHDCGINQVYNHAGVAAFSSNDFDAAEQYLKQAEEADALDEKGREYQSLLSDYRAYWEEELEYRQQEAKSDDLPRVRLQTTQGDIVVELFENEAPQTVANFISLVEQPFYDGLTFHRVLKGFMAQTGCPIGDGTGDPGYNIYCECQDGEYRKHFRGSLSMAHAGLNTGGSQFFITFRPTDHLNGKHTVFGRVIEGMDVLTKIQRIDPDGSPPLPEPDKIIKAEVLRKRDHQYVPTKVEG